MLTLQSQYKINDVVTIKLVTGEELITKITEINPDYFVTSRPLVFTINPQNGQTMIIPWLMSVDPKDNTAITIQKSATVAITKPVKQISDTYLQATTGIVTAPLGLKL